MTTRRLTKHDKIRIAIARMLLNLWVSDDGRFLLKATGGIHCEISVYQPLRNLSQAMTLLNNRFVRDNWHVEMKREKGKEAHKWFVSLASTQDAGAATHTCVSYNLAEALSLAIFEVMVSKRPDLSDIIKIDVNEKSLHKWSLKI